MWVGIIMFIYIYMYICKIHGLWHTYHWSLFYMPLGYSLILVLSLWDYLQFILYISWLYIIVGMLYPLLDSDLLWEQGPFLSFFISQYLAWCLAHSRPLMNACRFVDFLLVQLYKCSIPDIRVFALAAFHTWNGLPHFHLLESLLTSRFSSGMIFHMKPFLIFPASNDFHQNYCVSFCKSYVLSLSKHVEGRD